MAKRKPRDVWQYGDFQTPRELAHTVCHRLVRMGIKPTSILEPTCGRGAFLVAATEMFPEAQTTLGVDINAQYVEEANEAVNPTHPCHVSIEQGDFFQIDWERILDRHFEPWLVLGNPPWVTNAELGLLKSTNLPIKNNFQKHRGLDALTGKANFDISEWMILQQVNWLKKHPGWIAMLVKTAVARKILRQMWKKSEPIGRATIIKIDAMQYFGAAVDACLFVFPVSIGEASQDCDVFDGFGQEMASGTIGYHEGTMVSNVTTFLANHHLIGSNKEYVWRSGVKHDCSKVMELVTDPDRCLTNGLGEKIDLEDTFLFPMLKSSDVAKGRINANRFMIVPQKEIGGNTSTIASRAPQTWTYLTAHGDRLDARASVIYRGKPRFSVFGVGRYTFAPWKVAISGFYKTIRFVKVGPVANKPVVFDDTVYFIPCWSEEETDFLMGLVQSEPFTELMHAMIFLDEKRPITAELLKRISLERLAKILGKISLYRTFTRLEYTGQLRFALYG